MKIKVARNPTIQVSEDHPAKAAAPPAGSRPSAKSAQAQIPSYDGPTKSSKAPSPGDKERIKTPLRAADLNPPHQVPKGGYPDQRPRRTRSQPPAQPEQYIRLRIRVNNGRLSVIDSHLVDGPLAQANSFPGANAYEITLDNRLLHSGALPDLGVQRSFMNLNGPKEQHGHHFTERDIYEFTARVPAHEITGDTFKRITVRLHRVKGETRSPQIGGANLATQFEREMRPVAELVGLPGSVLPRAIEERGARTPNV